MSDELLTPEQAAKLIGRSPATLHGWRTAGQGPAFVRVGRAARYPKEDVEVFLRARPIKTDPKSFISKTGLTEREQIERCDLQMSRHPGSKPLGKYDHMPTIYVTVEEIAAAWGWTRGRVRALFRRAEFFEHTWEYGIAPHLWAVKISCSSLDRARAIIRTETGEKVPDIRPPSRKPAATGGHS